jgi:hypothetical protein
MRRASFARIGCGVESPSRVTHKSLRKGINLNHVDRAAELLRSADIQLSKFLILGHAGETEADMLGYTDYALKHGTHLQRTTFFVMTPYPGTELADEYADRGWITSRNWDLYTNFGAVVAPDGISAERLQVLHCAVAASYGARRRFAEGKGLMKILERLLEPLLLYAAMSRVKGVPTKDVEIGVMEALALMAGRQVRSGGRHPGRRAVRFHLEGQPDVVVAITEVDGTHELIVSVGEERVRDGRGSLREIRISVRALVAFVGAVDYPRLAHDAMVLGRHPRRFRVSWLPSLGRQVLRIGMGAAGLVAGHVAPRFHRNRARFAGVHARSSEREAE